MNPVALAQQKRAQELQVLQKENEMLKQRVVVLEEAEGKVEDLTVQVEQRLQQPSTSKEVEGGFVDVDGKTKVQIRRKG